MNILVSNTQYSASLEDERRLIQEQLAFHRGVIDRLLFKHNALSSPACLPLELLYEIFRHYISSYHGNEEPFALLRILHTCHHWRSVAINLPILWSHIIITPCKEWARMMVTYSKQCPLTIQATAGKVYKYTVASLKVALSQMHRIAALHLVLPPGAFKIIIKCLKAPAPMLQFIELHADKGTRNEAPSLTFQPTCPNLRGIHTTLPLSAIRSIPRETVRDIYLDLWDLRSTHQSELRSDLLNFLGSMRILEHVFIRTSLNEVSSDSREVSLPYIKILEIHGPGKFHEWLLKTLQYPKNALIRLNCHSSSFTSHSPYAVAFASHWSNYNQPMGSPPGLLELIERSVESNPKRSRRYTGHWVESHAGSSDIPTLEVSLPSITMLDAEWLRSQLTLSAVQVLCLSLVRPLPQDASLNPLRSVGDILCEMKNIKTLILRGWTETSIAAALETSVDCMRGFRHGGQRPQDVLFPELETLVLIDGNFGPVEGKGPDGFYRELSFGLRDRGELLAPVKTLIIEGGKCLYGSDIQFHAPSTNVLWKGIRNERDFSYWSI